MPRLVLARFAAKGFAHTQDMRGSLSKLMSNRRTSNAATTPQGTPFTAEPLLLSHSPTPAPPRLRFALKCVNFFSHSTFFLVCFVWFASLCCLCFDCATRSRRASAAAVEFLLFVFPFYCQRAVDGASSTPSSPSLALPFALSAAATAQLRDTPTPLQLRLRVRLRLRLQLRLGVDSPRADSLPPSPFPSDFYAFRLFPHVVSAAFPAWPSSACRLTRAHSLSPSLFFLCLFLSAFCAAFFNLSFIFCGIFCPFSTARDFERIAAGVILLRPRLEQSLSSFRVDSYYFAFKNRFAFVYK